MLFNVLNLRFSHWRRKANRLYIFSACRKGLGTERERTNAKARFSRQVRTRRAGGIGGSLYMPETIFRECRCMKLFHVNALKSTLLVQEKRIIIICSLLARAVILQNRVETNTHTSAWTYTCIYTSVQGVRVRGRPMALDLV